MGKNSMLGYRQGNLVYKLNIVATRLNDSADAIFVEFTGLDIRTIRVLRLVGDNPDITFAEIARMTAFERSLTSRLIQNLVRSELIERRNYVADARRFGLFITEAGQRIRERADLLSDRGMGLAFGQLDQSEYQSLFVTLEKLALWLHSDAYQSGLNDICEDLKSLSP